MGFSTPLSNTRARAVNEAGCLEDLQGGVGGRGTSGSKLADVAVSLDDVASRLEALEATHSTILGPLADDMVYVQRERQLNVSNLAKAAGELLDEVAREQRESPSVVSREVQAEKVRQLNLDKKRVIADIVAGDGRVDTLQREAEDLRQKTSSASVSESDRRRGVEKTVPLLEKKLQLLLHVSKAKIYKKDDGSVEGFVTGSGGGSGPTGANAEGDDIVPFKFGASDVARVNQVNELWSMM